MDSQRLYTLKLIYRGGDADKNQLKLYDGANSIFGFSKVIQLAVHGFINNKIIKNAPAMKGAEIYILPARNGSFLETIKILITDPNFMMSVGTGVVGSALYDFLKTTIGKAVGKIFKPETSTVSKLIQKDEPFFDELANILEGPLVEAHRTIEKSGGTVSLDRPKSTLVVFNNETLNWVKTQKEDNIPIKRVGNVTRFNIISKNGRFYDTDEKRTIPFIPDGTLSHKATTLLSRSLDDANNQLSGLLEFKVIPVRSASDVIKRYILLDCKKYDELGPASDL